MPRKKGGPRAPRVKNDDSLPMFIGAIRTVKPDFSLTTNTETIPVGESKQIIAAYKKALVDFANSREAGSGDKFTDKGVNAKAANLQKALVAELCIVDGKLAEKNVDKTTNATSLPEGAKELVPMLEIEGGTEPKGLLEILASL